MQLHSLRFKLTVLVGLILLLTLVTVSIPIMLSQKAELETSLSRQALMEVDRASLSTAAYFSDAIGIVRRARNCLETIVLDKNSGSKLLGSFVQGIPEISSSYFATTLSVKNGGPWWDSSGWVPPVGYDQTIRPWWTAALAVQDFAITAPYLDANTSGLVVSVVAPVFNESKKVSGVVGLDLLISKLNEIAGSIKVSPNGVSYILDKDGLYITNEKQEKILKENFFTEYGFESSKVSIQEQTSFFTMNAGKGYYLSASRIAEWSDWYIVTTGPLSEIFDPILRSFLIIFFMSVAGLVIGLAIFWFIAGGVVKPIIFVSQTLQDIAEGEGDLTKQLVVKEQDEVGQLAHHFNQFSGKLAGLVNDIRSSLVVLQNVGHELSSSSIETAASLNQITSNIASTRGEIEKQAQAATTSSASVKEINKTVEELTFRIDAQFKSIQISSAAIEQMVANIDSVTKVVDEMDRGYQDLTESSVSTRKMISDVNLRVQEILNSSVNLRQANTLIAKIASQTSLLAMNAAIEAAHAGDYGRGFSVVADEIRNLADNSTTQAKTTSTMLKQIEGSILVASNTSKEADLTLKGFMVKLENFASLEKQIETAMKEQSQGSKQILENLAAIHTTTQGVQESNTSINELNSRITTDIESLYQISMEIHHSMDEIAQGANEINEAVTIISDMSIKNREVIEGVNSGISRFKTS